MQKTKGDLTREMILEKAAPVFNRQGYFGTSMSDIMAATGLEKGGIYNHFSGKDDLALQAFDYSMDIVREEYAEAIKGKRHAIERLIAIIHVFKGRPMGTPIPGGCPVMNTAIEADDTHSELRHRAKDAMDEWQDFLSRIINRGIERGEIRPEVDAEELGTLMIAMLEGGIMMTRLHKDRVHMERAIAHLVQHIETSVRAPELD